QSRRVWDYVQGFGPWREHRLSVRILIEGKRISLPLNLKGLRSFFSKAEALSLEQKLLAHFGPDRFVPIPQLARSRDKALEKLAHLVCEQIYQPYLAKRTGLESGKSPPALCVRMPVSTCQEDHYYVEPFQGIPADSYCDFFGRLLNHPGIHRLLHVEALDILELNENSGTPRLFGQPFNGRVFYTGRLDELFNFRFGALDFRSLRLEFETHNKPFFLQDADALLLPDNSSCNRITEFKRITGHKGPNTTILREYSQAYDPAVGNEPYFPVSNDENRKRLRRYWELAGRFPQLYCLGPQPNHRIYPMDVSIEQTLNLVDQIVSQETFVIENIEIPDVDDLLTFETIEAIEIGEAAEAGN
ncbi:MAG: UDP-galactopyranose mutase, partial [Pseudomonadota bacterium]